MIFLRIKSIHRGKGGFTLVELLVAIAIVGIITLGITMTISQIWTINVGASNHMIAVRQVQQAGKEVSKDTLQAQNVTAGENWGFPLNLEWEDWERTVNEVTYTIEDDELWRSLTITPDEGQPTTTTSIIARYIDATVDHATGRPRTNCIRDEDEDGKVLIIFTVTAKVGNGPQASSETRIYEAGPRPTG